MNDTFSVKANDPGTLRIKTISSPFFIACYSITQNGNNELILTDLILY